MKRDYMTSYYHAQRVARRTRLLAAIEGDDHAMRWYASSRIPYSMRHFEGYETKMRRITRHIMRARKLCAGRAAQSVKVVHHHPGQRTSWGNS